MKTKFEVETSIKQKLHFSQIENTFSPFLTFLPANVFYIKILSSRHRVPYRKRFVLQMALAILRQATGEKLQRYKKTTLLSIQIVLG